MAEFQSIFTGQEVDNTINKLRSWIVVDGTYPTVTISGITYAVIWKSIPVSGKACYGIGLHPTTGRPYEIYYDGSSYTATALDADTKNTAGATNDTGKLYLVGTKTQDTNPQTYSNNQVYMTNGVLTTNSISTNVIDSSNTTLTLNVNGSTLAEFDGSLDGGTRIITYGYLTVWGDNDSNNVRKPDNKTGFTDLDTHYFNTGITLQNADGDTTYKLSFPAKSGTFALTSDTQISGTVTKEIGGISKDKVYTDADIIDVLSDLLFPYVAPKMSDITLSDAAGTYEYGTAKTVSKVTPNFTKGSKNIASIKIGTRSGDGDLYSGTSATSGTTITLTTSKTYDGKTIGSNNIYCTISDGTQSASTSATIKYVYYTYSKLTTGTSPDTSGATRQNQSDADSTYSYTAGQYLWLYSRDANKKIQTYVAGSWAGVNTTASSEITLTLSSGATAKYYAYRTDKFTATGQARYRLA